jgi:drug/metabolite transporter (DMT)-like permease
MNDDQVQAIRALLRSGEPIEIGGRPRHSSTKARTSMSGRVLTTSPSTTGIVAAFAAVYLIWGSTYLGIRYAVETIPPLLMMGIRHLTAGTLLYAWTRSRGTPAPRLREWFYPALIGMLLFLGGHGSLAWAEQHVPSGIAALLVATLPLWIVVLARVSRTERHLSRSSLGGLVLGFIGVGVLFGPDVVRHNGELNLVGAAAVLFGTFIWAAGTIWMRNVQMPESPVLSSAMQMLAGGAALVIAASLMGETRGFHIANVSAISWLSLAYLILFGSIIAFTAYTWLHMAAPPSRVATYAYVNPVVAVLLGWALASEPTSVTTWIAMLVILAGVAFVNTGHKEEHDPAHPETQREEEVAA